MVSQLVKKFLVPYGTRKFITTSQQPTTCPHPKPDKSSPTFLRSILMLFNILRLPFPSYLSNSSPHIFQYMETKSKFTFGNLTKFHLPVWNVSEVKATKSSDKLIENFARLHIVILKLRNHLNKSWLFYKRQFQETISGHKWISSAVSTLHKFVDPPCCYYYYYYWFQEVKINAFRCL